MRAFGEPGVLSLALNGKSVKCNFYYLELNPSLFDVARRVLVPGKDYRLEDVMSRRDARFVRWLAKHNYSLRAHGLEKTKTSLKAFQSMCSRINRACRDCGLPEALGVELGDPHLFFVREELATLFGIELASALSMAVFSEKKQKTIRFIAEHPGSSHAELIEQRGFSRTRARKIVLEISERAALFGVDAFARSKNKGFRFSLSEEFAEAVAEKPSEKQSLSAYFTPRQEQIIWFFALHPTARFQTLFPEYACFGGTLPSKWMKVETGALKTSFQNHFPGLNYGAPNILSLWRLLNCLTCLS
ncbi:hypothetical protein HY992_00920 [Candidatus Micrarchaeota archaeon]|nr:hypothetical protein [Candidatus Micrarchaeota archaeon]